MIAAICDYEPLFREMMEKFLLEYRRTRRIHLDIEQFSSGRDLLDYKYPCDIVFLDYDMPGLNGMDTARELRRKKNLCCIIFVSSYPEHVFEAYEVNTYRYLVKPLELGKLEKALDCYIKEKKMLCPISVYVDGEQIIVNSEEILFLEGDGKYCNIRTETDILHCSKTISQVVELLPQHCFYRIHKSYAVNLHCIASIKENTLILINGEKIQISRSRLTAFKEAYKDFAKHFILGN